MDIDTIDLDIRKKIFVLHDLMVKIKDLDTAIATVDSKDVKDDAIGRLKETIVSYKTLLTELENDLQQYFILEKDSNLPINLAFRKVYKRIKA